MAPPVTPGEQADEQRIAALQAELQTVLNWLPMDTTLEPLERLAEAAREEIGADHPVTLRIECELEDHRSQRRPISASAHCWEQLAHRAAYLPENDLLRLRIAAFIAQYRRRRGTPPDLAAGVALYEREWERRRALLGEDAQATRTIALELALAIRDRDGDGDLADAIARLESELVFRQRVYDATPFTATAAAALAQTLTIAAARHPDGGTGRVLTDRATKVAEQAVRIRRERFGGLAAATLRARLVHATAVMTAGRADEALREAEEVHAAAVATDAVIDPGWVEHVLAEAQEAAGCPTAVALATAEVCLARREARYPADSVLVAEARQLRDRLRTASG